VCDLAIPAAILVEWIVSKCSVFFEGKYPKTYLEKQVPLEQRAELAWTKRQFLQALAAGLMQRNRSPSMTCSVLAHRGRENRLIRNIVDLSPPSSLEVVDGWQSLPS